MSESTGSTATGKSSPASTTLSSSSKATESNTNQPDLKSEIESKLQEAKQAFSRIGNKEKELTARESQLQEYVRVYPEYTRIKGELEALRKVVVSDPARAYYEAGGNPADAPNKMAAAAMNANPQTVLLKAMQDEVTALKTQLQEERSAREKADVQKQQQSLLEQIKAISETDAPIVAKSGSYGLVETMLNQLKSEIGDQADVKGAAKKAEEHLKNEIKKVIQMKAISPDEVLAWIKVEEEKLKTDKVEEPKKVSEIKETSSKPEDSDTSEKPKTLEEARVRALKQLRERIKRTA